MLHNVIRIMYWLTTSDSDCKHSKSTGVFFFWFFYGLVFGSKQRLMRYGGHG